MMDARTEYRRFAINSQSSDSLRRKQLEVSMYLSDARFFRDLAGDLANKKLGDLALAFMPWFALFITESLALLRRSEGVHFEAFDEGASEARIETLRHSIKWMSQPKTTSDYWLGVFRSRVAEQRLEFLGHARFRWARRFERDLAVLEVDGRFLATGHQMAHVYDFDFSVVDGEWFSGLARDIAAFSASAYPEDVEFGPSFVRPILPSSVRWHDTLSSRFYVLDGQQDDNAGYLFALAGFLSSADLIRLGPYLPDDITALKIRWVALFQVRESLRLLSRQGDQLARVAASLLADSDQRLPALGSKQGRWLRNFLVHYTVHPDLDLSAFASDAPGLGVPRVFFGEGGDQLFTAAAHEVSNLRAAILASIGPRADALPRASRERRDLARWRSAAERIGGSV